MASKLIGKVRKGRGEELGGFAPVSANPGVARRCQVGTETHLARLLHWQGKDGKMRVNDTKNRPLYGNGGGVFVTTSFFDDGPPTGAGWGAAFVFSSDGSFTSSSSGTLSINSNAAARWGGGFYAGIAPPWWGVYSWDANNYSATSVVLGGASIQNNTAPGKIYVNGVGLVNTQIAIERVRDDNFSTAQLNLQNDVISGGSSDLGFYLWDSLVPTMNNITFPNLIYPIIQQP